MKKFVLPFFSCLLVLTLLLGSFGSARAEVGDDPVVTPISGDMEFSTEVVPIAALPGTIELADLMLAPAGFPEGEAQFEGAGVLVTKFDAGKATACFTISGTQWGWGGKVGMWNGTKWMLLPTTITSPDETPNSIACATIAGSGTYAFIKYIVDSSLLPPNYPKCQFTYTPYFYHYEEWNISGEYTPDFYMSEALPVGTPIPYKVLNFSQSGSIVGLLEGLTYAAWGGRWIEFPYVFSYIYDNFEYLEIYVELPTCYLIVNWDTSTSAANYGGTPWDGLP